MPIDQFAIDLIKSQRESLGISNRKLGRVPAQKYPRQFEAKYSRKLLALVRSWEALVKENLFPLLTGIAQDYDLENDNPMRSDGAVEDLNKLMQVIETGMTIAPETRLLALNIGQNTSEWNDKNWRRTLRTVLGVDVFTREPWLENLLQGFADKNVALITKMRDETLQDIRRITIEGLESGKRVRTIRAEILNGTKLQAGRFKKTRTRAQLIARDQIGKLNSQLTENRQTALGIDDYTWRTALDERVRGNPAGLYPNAVPSHYDREGKTFSWNDPPAGGHPGEAIQCRCVAEPNIEELADLIGPQGKDLVPLPKGQKKKTGKEIDLKEFKPPTTDQEAIDNWTAWLNQPEAPTVKNQNQFRQHLKGLGFSKTTGADFDNANRNQILLGYYKTGNLLGPEISSQAFKGITSRRISALARAPLTFYKGQDRTMQLNSISFKDKSGLVGPSGTVRTLDKPIRENMNSGFSAPSNKGEEIASIISHEAGHQVTRYERGFIEMKDGLGRPGKVWIPHQKGTKPSAGFNAELYPFFEEVRDRKLRKDLRKSYKTEEEFKKLVDEMTPTARDQARKESLTADLSEYASTDYFEFVSEGWTEYVHSDNPRPVAKKIGETVEKYYSEGGTLY